MINPAARIESTRFVNIGSVFDAMNVRGVPFKIECEQDAVVTTACSAQAQELIGERLAEPLRIVSQSSGDELADCGGSFLRQPTKSLQRGTGDFGLPRTLVIRCCFAHLGGSLPLLELYGPAR